MCRASPWGAAPFQVFLASSRCAASVTSYHFSSSASPPWHNVFSRFAPVVNSAVSVLASGSNCAVKPTRLRRAAYFLSLALQQRRHLFCNCLSKQRRNGISNLFYYLSTISEEFEIIIERLNPRPFPWCKCPVLLWMNAPV